MRIFIVISSLLGILSIGFIVGATIPPSSSKELFKDQRIILQTIKDPEILSDAELLQELINVIEKAQTSDENNDNELASVFCCTGSINNQIGLCSVSSGSKWKCENKSEHGCSWQCK